MSVLVNRKVVLNSSKFREETLDGRKFLVVPTVLITDGVHVGNAGALYYPSGTNSKNPSDWNHAPLVVYHPEIQGQLVSARTPDIIEKRKVGYIFNTTYNAPKLIAESWFDIEKTDKVDPRIIPAIRNGETLEVSTGASMAVEDKVGDFGGVQYTGVVHNIHPDHLAILPDQIGACSKDKGCGCGVNVANKSKNMQLVMNQTSYGNILRKIEKAMEVKYGYVYVRDVYDGFFIYSVSLDGERRYYRRDYSVDGDGSVTLVEAEPVEVKWVQEYRTVDGKFVGNTDKGINVDNREKLIKDILACNVGYEETDLKGFDEATLKVRLEKAKGSIVANKTAPVVVEPPVASPAAANPFESFLVANGINAGELQDLILGARDIKTTLITNITAKSDKFPMDWLQKQPIKALQTIESLVVPQQVATAPVQVVNSGWYGGQAVANASPGHKQEPLAPVDVLTLVSAK